MKKYIRISGVLAGLMFFCALACLAEKAEAPPFPSEFTITERVISVTDTFEIEANKKKYGAITEALISLTKSFEYKDQNKKCVAKASAKLVSWGSHVVVTDCDKNKIGSIKENVVKSLFSVYTNYSILDAKDKEIAISEKVDWITTELTLTDKEGQVIVELKRPWINIVSD
ncbi:hypothetical protein ACFL6Y_12000, partial [Elusimicrobiota bacterium]